MKCSWCVPVVVAALAVGCSAPAGRATLHLSKPAGPASIRVGIRDGNKTTIRKVPLEDYVQAAILSEFAPPSGEPAIVERMLEVQAVIGYVCTRARADMRQSVSKCAPPPTASCSAARVRTYDGPRSRVCVRRGGDVLWFDGAPATHSFTRTRCTRAKRRCLGGAVSHTFVDARCPAADRACHMAYDVARCGAHGAQ